MARVYTDTELEAVWALMCEGYGNTAIHKILRDGEGPLGYRVEIPVASLKRHRRKLIDERGDPRPALTPGEEQDAYSAARRQVGAALVNEAKRLTGKAARSGMLDGKELADLIRVEKALYEIENRAEKPSNRNSDRVKRSNETRRANDVETLAQMAARYREENEGSPADGEAPDSRSSSVSVESG